YSLDYFNRESGSSSTQALARGNNGFRNDRSHLPWQSDFVLQRINMYKAFFGLNRNPFEIGPDPFFFYPTARHNEALANLYYGIRRKKGFVVVPGEVGTGKTLLVRSLMEPLQPSHIE